MSLSWRNRPREGASFSLRGQDSRSIMKRKSTVPSPSPQLLLDWGKVRLSFCQRLREVQLGDEAEGSGLGWEADQECGEREEESRRGRRRRRGGGTANYTKQLWGLLKSRMKQRAAEASAAVGAEEAPAGIPTRGEFCSSIPSGD